MLLLFIVAVRPEKPSGAAAAGDPELVGVASAAGERVGAMDVAVARLAGPRSACPYTTDAAEAALRAVGTMHVSGKLWHPVQYA